MEKFVRKGLLSFILLQAILVSSCAVPKVQKPSVDTYKNKSDLSFIYQNKYQAYAARGFTTEHVDQLVYPQFILSPVKTKQQLVLNQNEISELNAILILPKDANFFSLREQQSLLINDRYLSQSGQIKTLQYDVKSAQEAPELEDVTLKKSTYKKKQKKLIIRN